MATDSAFLAGSRVILIDAAGSQTTLEKQGRKSPSKSITFTRSVDELKPHFRAQTVINVSVQNKNVSMMSFFFFSY